MRIGVISDTHGSVSAWQKAMDVFGEVDLILHAGDVLYHPPRLMPNQEYDIPTLVQLINSSNVPIVIARGNCDAEVYEELLEAPVLSPYAVVQFGRLRIVITHGHTLDEDKMSKVAAKYRANILVTGHTHLPVIEKIDNAIHINPGSPTHPKFQRAGILVPTVGIISKEKVSVLELESGKEILSLPLASP
ncbi:MAG: phosphodiesterase [Armatimonadota bacterium]|nr:phosphodiesterase [Armatimonadota bacterium]